MKKSSKIIGAAFLMATSAIGPGFLTQTAYFSESLLANFGFVILVSVLIDSIAQVGIWKVLTYSGLKANDLGNKVLPFLGDILAFLVFFGGICFNIGNIGGAGLALKTLFNIEPQVGAIISCIIAVALFVLKEFQSYMDLFVKILGGILILSVLLLLGKITPDFSHIAIKTIFPDKFDANATLTLIGGTVGGYISFAGAHRLIEGGLIGPSNQSKVVQSAVLGVFTASIFRYILFIAAVTLLSMGLVFNKSNPAESIFLLGFGSMGKYLFGIVLWSASITSVTGSAYTSISFVGKMKFFNKIPTNFQIVIFIIFSTLIFITIGKPVEILLLVGYLNAFILPIGLSIVLIASFNKKLFDQRPINNILRVGIVLVIVSMTFLAIKSLI